MLVARVAKKRRDKYKILRALTILVRFKKKNGAYTEKEKIPKKIISRVGAWPAYAKRGHIHTKYKNTSKVCILKRRKYQTKFI